MTSSDTFYVGDQWDLEAVLTNPKTGKRVEPGAVTVTVYPPGARRTTPTREPLGPLTATRVGEGETATWEVVGVELNEAGQWLAVWDTTAPYKGTQPEVISVSEPK